MRIAQPANNTHGITHPQNAHKITLVSCAIFLLIFRWRSCVYSRVKPDGKDVLVDVEVEVLLYFPVEALPAGL